MGITIGRLPEEFIESPVVLQLDCDARSSELCCGAEVFLHPDGYIGQHRLAMEAGWLDRAGPNGRMWLCPKCSGKKPDA